MLKDPQLSPVYLAIDALDECTQGRSDLIHLISTSLILSQKVKWLLSSRPEVDLLAVLKDPSNSLVELDSVWNNLSMHTSILFANKTRLRPCSPAFFARRSG